MSSFFETTLKQEIVKNLLNMGFLVPTPIQERAIPEILAGKNIMAAAKTGTGKTGAYLLPVINKLLEFANTSTSPAKHPVRALVLAPTRELVEQINQEVKKFLGAIPLKTAAIYGGTDFSPQKTTLMGGVEIIAATPGRLLDHLESMPQLLKSVNILVLDEADRMLDMGFMPDLQKIITFLPANQQRLLFSATFSSEIKKLAHSMLDHPVEIQLDSPNTTADLVSQVAVYFDRSRTEDILIRLMRAYPLFPAIIFTNTKQDCARLNRILMQHGFRADSIHGDKTQAERHRALEALKANQIDLLIATDVAARGLDVQGLPMVVNAQVPYNPEDYVHRIGRTGRANQKGVAYTLVSAAQQEAWQAVEKLIQKQVVRMNHQDLPMIVAEKNERVAIGKSQFAQKAAMDMAWFYQPYQPGEELLANESLHDIHGELIAKKKPILNNGSAHQTASKKSMPALFSREFAKQMKKNTV